MSPLVYILDSESWKGKVWYVFAFNVNFIFTFVSSYHLCDYSWLIYIRKCGSYYFLFWLRYYQPKYSEVYGSSCEENCCVYFVCVLNIVTALCTHPNVKIVNVRVYLKHYLWPYLKIRSFHKIKKLSITEETVYLLYSLNSWCEVK